MRRAGSPPCLPALFCSRCYNPRGQRVCLPVAYCTALPTSLRRLGALACLGVTPPFLLPSIPHFLVHIIMKAEKKEEEVLIVVAVMVDVERRG